MFKRLFFNLVPVLFAIILITGCGPEEYLVNLEVEPEEAGTVSGEGSFDKGEEVVVEAQPAENYSFVKWLQEGKEVSRSPEYNFEVQEDKKLEARFDGPEPLLYQIENQELTYEEIIRMLWNFEASVVLIEEDDEGDEIFGETRYFDEDGKVTVKESNFNFELHGDAEFSRTHLAEKWDISPEEVGFYDAYNHVEVIEENQLEDKGLREGGSGYTAMYMFREVPAGSSIELELSPLVKENLDLKAKRLNIEAQE